MNVDANSSSLFLGNFPYRIDIFAQGREPTSFPLAVGTNATVRRSERTSRTDVQPGIAQAARNQLTCSKIAQLSTRAGIRVATAISIRRGKLRHAPPRFHFRTDVALFARRDDCPIYSLAEDRHFSSQIDFSLVHRYYYGTALQF